MSRRKAPEQLSLFTADQSLKRTPLRYFGGKWMVAPWIYQRFPVHQKYIELFGGSFSVGLRKSPAKTSIYNDKNARVFNFFVQAKYRPQAVLKAARAHQQRDLALWWQQSKDAIEDAARIFLIGAHGFTGAGGRWAGGLGDRPAPPFDTLPLLSHRLQTVDLYNSDYQVFLSNTALFDSDTLIYADPPYLHHVRGSKDARHKQGAPRRQYAHELNEAQHLDLLERLKALPCMVVLSGSWSSLYEIHLKDWVWCKRKSPNSTLAPRSIQFEFLWFNPMAMDRLGLRGWPCVA